MQFIYKKTQKNSFKSKKKTKTKCRISRNKLVLSGKWDMEDVGSDCKKTHK